MLSYKTPESIKADNARADQIMKDKGYDVPHGVATAARTLKQARETIPQFLARIGYSR